jgi:uncharacterized membrane protein
MQESPPFRNRGRDITRLEAFSDVVFGFALTLIVVSIEVPTTFGELMEVMQGFLAFAICFAILIWVWHAHHTFFRRYALDDEYMIFLNTLLLFVVLFYTYPMKFMFTLITRDTDLKYGEVVDLFVIYGLGFAGIFAIYVLMYLHAWRKRDALQLNEYEKHDTVTKMMFYGSYVIIGAISTVIAVTAPPGWLSTAGSVYWIIGPVSGIIGWRRGVGRTRVAPQMAAEAA